MIVELERVLGRYLNGMILERGEVKLLVGALEKVPFILQYLKGSEKILGETLLDIWGLDLGGGRNKRFMVCYKITSMQYNLNIQLVLRLGIKDFLCSAREVFGAANWLEREIWDMFGIYVANHSDLRRILTDYGFVGYPLRKDFPLSGFLEVYYEDSRKRIMSRPVTLLQEFRFFDSASPWVYREIK